MDVAQITGDLVAEQQALDDIVAALDDDAWRRPTPSPGWTVTDQIAHLAHFDESAVRALTDPDAFTRDVERLLAAAGAGGDAAIDELTLGEGRRSGPAALLHRWRAARTALAGAASGVPDGTRVPWYGPAMGATSFLTARLMEVWAHGQDVADALGVNRPGSDRLRHIVQLGFLTRAWSYTNRGRPVPAEPVGLELSGPAGDLWRFGPDDAAESVTGPALDFCLVVTQRRHLDDTRLVTTPLARDWLLIAQAFAGPATDGPAPGTRP